MRRAAAALYRRISSLHRSDAHHPPTGRHRARRLSDVLRDAPAGVVEAAAAILLGRLYQRRPPVSWSRSIGFSYRARLAREYCRGAENGRGAPNTVPRAPIRSGAAFRRAERALFPECARATTARVSSRPWKSPAGVFDPALRQIVLNRQLGQRRHPRYVVATFCITRWPASESIRRSSRRGAAGNRIPGVRREEKVFCRTTRGP